MQQDWFFWAMSLAVGLPMGVITLGELAERLNNNNNPFGNTVASVRNLLLPIFVGMVFIQKVLLFDTQGTFVKGVRTIFWICLINICLSLVNNTLFAAVKGDSWRARLPKLLVDLCRLFLVVVGGSIVAATVWNADIAGLATALGVGSIVIGLALQDTLGSIMSGIALLFERPFSVGDWLKVGDIIGQVIDVNWRSVRLQTRERELIIIPHQLMGREVVCNYSGPIKLHAERLIMTFSYNHPPNLAKEILKATARSTPGILLDPEPEVRTISYGDFAIEYEVRFYIRDYLDLENIRDRFMTRIWYAAQRHKLNIPFPIRTLYHFHGPTAKADTTAKKFEESLQSMPLFFSHIKHLTQDAVLQHFGVGERIIRQGEPGQALYIIVVGKVILTIKNSDGKEQEVMTLNRGDFFGEIALFTGEPSTVSVFASEDLEVMVIYRETVNQLIERQPSLAREIAQIIDLRRKSIQANS